MKLYLIIVALTGYLFATNTYDEHYSVFDNNSSSKNYDLLMHGEFKDIIRYKEISYKDINNSDESNRIENIVNKILSYDENRVLVSIIGHTNIDRDKNSTEQIEITKEYVQDTVSILEEYNISKEIMIVEYRGDKDNLYTQGTQEGKELSNQVMISLYIKKEEEKDSDSDGVVDNIDECPNTLEGLDVNEKGCHIPETLTLNYITNSSIINKESMDKVRKFTEFLKNNTIYKVTIIGHTDNIGSVKKNQILSEKRANSLKDYLVLHEIDPSRVSIIGAGENKPLVDNDTEINRAKNRRIEVETKFIQDEGLDNVQ